MVAREKQSRFWMWQILAASIFWTIGAPPMKINLLLRHVTSQNQRLSFLTPLGVGGMKDRGNTRLRGLALISILQNDMTSFSIFGRNLWQVVDLCLLISNLIRRHWIWSLWKNSIRDFSPYMVSVYTLKYEPFTHHLSELSTSSQGLFLHVRLCAFVNFYCTFTVDWFQ